MRRKDIPQRVICWLVIVTAALTVSAQGTDMAAKDYHASTLNMQKGLSSNSITDIMEDSFGFVWIASDVGGLARYDGYSLMQLGVGTPGLSLRSSSCHNLCEDKHHRLWIALEECTEVLDLTTMTLLSANALTSDAKIQQRLSGLLNDGAMRTYCDHEGKIWLVTHKEVCCLRFDTDGKVSELQTLPYQIRPITVSAVDVEKNGTLWASVDGSIYRYALGKGRLVRSEVPAVLREAVSRRYVTDMLRQGDALWVGTNIGLLRYDLKRNSVESYQKGTGENDLAHNFVTSLELWNNSELLVGTLLGIHIYKGKGIFERWDSRSSVNPLNSDFVHCMLASHGLLWIGTDNAGVMRLIPRQLTLRNYVHDALRPTSLSAGCVNAMYVQDDGTLWVGTVEGGLNRRMADGSTFEHYTTANSRLTHNSVSALTADKRGLLWIGTWGGGMCVLDMNHPNEVYPLSVPPEYQVIINYVGALEYDALNNGLWIGSNGGIYFYNFATRQLEEPYEGCRDVRGCIGSIIDKDGNLWMGCLTGLRKIDLKSGRNGRRPFKVTAMVHKLDNPKSGIIDKIIAFCQTTDGTLWLGSNGYGLYRRMKNEKGETIFKCYSMEDGLPNNAVKGIVEGRDGHLWVATTNGISELDPKTEMFTNYTEDDGFVSSQFYWNALVSDHRGKIYVAADKGLTELTDGRSNSVYTGHLRFTSLYVDHQQVNSDGHILHQDISIANEITLHESNKSFVIEFSSLTYGHERQGVYSYRLKGFDKRWIQLEPGEHSVSFTRLPPGDYTLEVKYASSLATESQRISIDIHVAPYFWKSWWFVALSLIVLAMLGAYLYKRRVEVLRKREAEKLMKPLEKVLRESDNPEQLQMRIQSILDNQRRYQESSAKSVQADTEEVKRKSKTFMERVMIVMEKNYMNSDFDVTQFCEQMGMSRSLLAKKLNEETGQSTVQFIRNYRLEIARQLLKEGGTNRNIAEIAFSVGFNDPKYFTRCFTKLYGSSPSSMF